MLWWSVIPALGPISLSLPSLAFFPKHKPFEAWQWNIENQLWENIVHGQGSNPEQPAFYAGTVELHHSSTRDYYSVVVGFILNPHNLLYSLVWMCCIMCYWWVKDLSLPSLAFFPNANCLKLDIKILKVNYGEESCMFKDWTQSNLHSRQVLWSSVFPAPDTTAPL